MLSRSKILSRRRADARRERLSMMTALGIALVSVGANARAESILQSGSSPVKASAHLDFRIVIPKVVRLDAATGALLTNAPATETVLISTEARGMRRTSASKAGDASRRSAAMSAFASSSAGPASYTVTMP
jgi:hypothetical protein